MQMKSSYLDISDGINVEQLLLRTSSSLNMKKSNISNNLFRYIIDSTDLREQTGKQLFSTGHEL